MLFRSRIDNDDRVGLEPKVSFHHTPVPGSHVPPPCGKVAGRENQDRERHHEFENRILQELNLTQPAWSSTPKLTPKLISGASPDESAALDNSSGAEEIKVLVVKHDRKHPGYGGSRS